MKQEISYTDTSEIDIPEEPKLKILSLIESVMSKLDIVEIPLGTDEMKDLTEMIELNYKTNLFKDTKEEIRVEIKQCIFELKKSLNNLVMDVKIESKTSFLYDIIYVSLLLNKNFLKKYN